MSDNNLIDDLEERENPSVLLYTDIPPILM